MLLVPGALVEDADWDTAAQALAEFAPDDLVRRLRRAGRRERRFDASWSDGAAHLQWLADAFGVPGEPPPTAPYAWHAAGAEAAGTDGAGSARQTWFCEPVHFVLGPERTVLAPIDRPALQPNEAEALLREANEAALELGARIESRGGRWFLHTREPWSIKAPPLDAVLGASVEARLPRGVPAARWRRLLNDVQMRWHASDVNRMREERGEQVANGLWLHGGGTMAALPQAAFDLVDGGDAVLDGWRRAAPAPVRPAAKQRRLSVWPHLFEPYWRKDWRAWAQEWVSLQQRLDAGDSPARSIAPIAPLDRAGLQLIACGRRTAVHFEFGHPLAWLRPRSLRDCLAERT
jgi:hypothetical protein